MIEGEGRGDGEADERQELHEQRQREKKPAAERIKEGMKQHDHERSQINYH